MAETALTSGPAIDLTITGTTAYPSLDAMKALMKVIKDFQDRVDGGEAFSPVATLTDIVAIQAGDDPFTLYKFQFIVGTDPDASPQVYNVDYVGSAATVADLPATPSAPA